MSPGRVEPGMSAPLDSLVIGAGAAGLSSTYHLTRAGLDVLVLDANAAPGGAWQHRWRTLTMRDVHGIAALPGLDVPASGAERASDFIPAYFAAYEERFDLPVLRPVRVTRVREGIDDLLIVETDRGRWLTRTLVNADGTWDRPFVPYYPGAEDFAGTHLHASGYRGTDELAGRRVVVVGGGASAVQILGEVAPVAETVWVTRRPPVWRTDDFDAAAGRAAVRMVEQRVRRGLPPQSVVGVTGLALREQEREALALGAYERRPMFERIEADGVRWSDGTSEPAEVIIWATGFRPVVAHLRDLALRAPGGGIALTGPAGDRSALTAAALDPRVQLVGYGPSASTIGATRAGRVAARNVRRLLASRVAGEAASA